MMRPIARTAAGPPAPARRWRGAPPDRPAARRDGVRVVAGWRLAGRHVVLARGDDAEDARRRGRASTAEAGRAARIRLPLHRPARLHAQRRGLHLRPGRALWVVDVATGSARRLTAGRTSESSTGLVAGRPRIAFVAEPAPRSRPRSSGATSSSPTSRRGEVAAITRGPTLALRHPTWLPDGRRSRRSATAPGGHGQPQRRLALRRRRLRRASPTADATCRPRTTSCRAPR